MRLESALGAPGVETERILGRGILFAEGFAESVAPRFPELSGSAVRAVLSSVSAFPDEAVFFPYSLGFEVCSAAAGSTLHPSGLTVSLRVSFDPGLTFFVLDGLLGGGKGPGGCGRLERALSLLESEVMEKTDGILRDAVLCALPPAFGMDFSVERNKEASYFPEMDYRFDSICLCAQIDIYKSSFIGYIVLAAALPRGLGAYARPSSYPSPCPVPVPLRPVIGVLDVDAAQWRHLGERDVLRIREPEEGQSFGDLYRSILAARVSRHEEGLSDAFSKASGLDVKIALLSVATRDEGAVADPGMTGWSVSHRDRVTGIRFACPGGQEGNAGLILGPRLADALIASADLDPGLAGFDPFASLCIQEFALAWTAAFLVAFHVFPAPLSVPPGGMSPGISAGNCFVHDLPEHYFSFNFDVCFSEGSSERLAWLVEGEAMRRLLPLRKVAGPPMSMEYGEYAACADAGVRTEIRELCVLDGSVPAAWGCLARAGSGKGVSLASFGAIK